MNEQNVVEREVQLQVSSLFVSAASSTFESDKVLLAASGPIPQRNTTLICVRPCFQAGHVFVDQEKKEKKSKFFSCFSTPCCSGAEKSPQLHSFRCIASSWLRSVAVQPRPVSGAHDDGRNQVLGWAGPRTRRMRLVVGCVPDRHGAFLCITIAAQWGDKISAAMADEI